ncbi:hypothetical protein L6R49_23365 [Myxococcota bacterium]|nr:hypothetical protein [Myxococcota bacterium]
MRLSAAPSLRLAPWVGLWSLVSLSAACKGEPPQDDAPQETEAPGDSDDVGDDSADDSGDADTQRWTFDGDTVTVAVDDPSAASRRYTLTTTHPLRGAGAPADGRREVVEDADDATLRSGNLFIDAFFALALDELDEASVSEIRDGSFNSGAAVPCDCWETGEEWTWVWTRDTAYAVHLGLAWIDPIRARDSLRFKLSERKAALGGGGLTLVQDTGTGGSWPVSTDRVVWALGARATLYALPEAERAAFAEDARAALRAAAEADREAAYDAADGLYRGEQSFLDWREQSYPAWVATDVVHIGMSKALGTNVLHLEALRLLAELSEEAGLTDDAARYDAWAADLGAAIHAAFWMEETGSWSTMLTTTLDPSPSQRLDALGLSLAALALDEPDAAARAVAAYPHGPYGPPVIFPQEPDTPIYHNRATWPFVTAYVARAGRAVGNEAVVASSGRALVRGALLNLSNMENLEWLSGDNYVAEGSTSGPVVNSRRQLWSVAGALSFIIGDLFGLALEDAGVSVSPLLPSALREEWFGDETTILLNNLPYRGRRLNLTLRLPSGGTTGPLVLGQLKVDGALVEGAFVSAERLTDGAALELTLVEDRRAPATVTTLDAGAASDAHTAPTPPALLSVLDEGEGGLRLRWTAQGEPGVTASVYRDGALVAEGLSDETWLDVGVESEAASPCYAVMTVWESTGVASHHSAPVCFWGEGDGRVQTVSAYGLSVEGGVWSEAHGRAHLGDFGDPDDTITAYGITPRWTGAHLLQLVGSAGGPINTGVCAGLKRVTVLRESDGAVLAEGPVLLAQSGAWDAWRDSSLLPVTLDATEPVRVLVEDMEQMSSFAHYQAYTGGEGGGDDACNHVNVAELKLLPRAGAAAASVTPAVALDGVNDIDAVNPAAVVSLGAGLETWSRIGLTWDAEALTLVVNSRAFEEDFTPFVLYVEADFGAATPTTGLEYSGLTPALPFTPTHTITLRRESDGGDGLGPWAGVWAWTDAGWSQRLRFEPAVTMFTAADNHTLSVRAPWAAFGSPETLRIAGHVVWARPSEEWKELVPYNHTPWASSVSGYAELDLSDPPEVSLWTVR